MARALPPCLYTWLGPDILVSRPVHHCEAGGDKMTLWRVIRRWRTIRLPAEQGDGFEGCGEHLPAQQGPGRSSEHPRPVWEPDALE